MKIINTGNSFQIYTDNLKTFDKLPPQVYTVNFAQMSGFSLTKTADIQVTEKIYGPHLSKVNKALATFKQIDRNLGIILSGEKGIGKSLCAKLIISEAVKAGYPVILCNGYIPGIASFLNSIEQEVVCVFDEFEKVFPVASDVGNSDAQTEMLTLFDGIYSSKKMFVITCNSVYNLNKYLINRPGRFHYHFRFSYPSAGEIREYLTDKLKPEYYSEIDKVVNFSCGVDINYDCLRAIAFELNLGSSFEDAIRDLNIIDIDDASFHVQVYLSNGLVLSTTTCLGLFSAKDISFKCYYSDADLAIRCTFSPTSIVITGYNNNIFVDGANVRMEVIGNPDIDMTNVKIKHIFIEKHKTQTYHYQNLTKIK